MKKNCDYWKSFINTGKIDDYLHYIACTQEESMDELIQVVDLSIRNMDLPIRRYGYFHAEQGHFNAEH